MLLCSRYFPQNKCCDPEFPLWKFKDAEQHLSVIAKLSSIIALFWGNVAGEIILLCLSYRLVCQLQHVNVSLLLEHKATFGQNIVHDRMELPRNALGRFRSPPAPCLSFSPGL